MDQATEQLVFDNFAKAYPHEIHAIWPDKFWEFFQRECRGVTREQMEKLLKETGDETYLPR